MIIIHVILNKKVSGDPDCYSDRQNNVENQLKSIKKKYVKRKQAF